MLGVSFQSKKKGGRGKMGGDGEGKPLLQGGMERLLGKKGSERKGY